MTDHTPSGLPQPQTRDPWLSDVQVQSATVYVLNKQPRPSNLWWASVQSGSDDNGLRLSWKECEAIAQKIAAALSAPAVETVAVQEATGETCTECLGSGDRGSCFECNGTGMIWTAVPLPVAPKAEPVARAFVDGDEACRELRWLPNMPSFDLPVGTLLYAGAQPVADRSAEARLAWLHSPASNNVDGWEWGIFKVRWGGVRAITKYDTPSQISPILTPPWALRSRPSKGAAMAEPLPKDNRCSRCGEWYHNAHACPRSAALSQGTRQAEPVAKEEASTMQVVAWRKTHRFQNGRVDYTFTWQKEHADDWARLDKPLEPLVCEADALAAIKAARVQALEDAIAACKSVPIDHVFVNTLEACASAIRLLGEDAGKP